MVRFCEIFGVANPVVWRMKMTHSFESTGAAEYIRPDRQFIKDVIRLGGKSAKICFQCGTCTASCNVSYAQGGDEPFPRQLMLWSQWGLKDKVLKDPSIWACHQCQDCSANCPRGAKPGDVLGALRAIAIQHYAVPGFMAKLYAEPKYLPLIFGIPAVVLVALLYVFQGLRFPQGEIIYEHFISDLYIEIAGFIVVGFAVLAASIGLLRFWRDIRASDLGSWAIGREVVSGPGSLAASGARPRPLEASFAETMVDIVKHEDFKACDTDRVRYWGHLILFYGTPFLLFATSLAAFYSFTGQEVQRPLTDPAKVTGNIGALGLVVGLTILIYNRLRAKRELWGGASYFDWFLLWIIYLATLTGVFLEVSRYAGLGTLAYSLYMVHLVIVFAMFVYAPYGKFAHSFYRTVAMTVIRHGGKGNPYRMWILLPVALGIAVGAVGVLTGVVVGITWLL